MSGLRISNKHLFIFFIIILTGASSLSAQNSALGDWEGVLEVPGAKLRIVFHIQEVGDSLKASWDSPDQGAFGLKVDEISLEGGVLKMTMKSAVAKYEGSYLAESDMLEGKFIQGGMNLDLNLNRQTEGGKKLAEKPTTPIAGDWYGKLETPTGKLRIVFHINEYEDGELSASLDSPDQGAKGIAASSIKFEEGVLKLEMMGGAAKYEGSYVANGDKIEGTFKQGGGELPLLMEREKPEGPKRPQTPQEPFPYKIEDVKYPNPSADIELGATLTLPEGEGPHPVVIMISGSGAQDRDETLLGHKPFWVIADYMSRRGLAVLRFDDRGVGESGGDPSTATSADFATDVEAGVKYLLSRSDINHSQIGLMGHSEGGMIAPILASRSEEVAFIVLLAGPGMRGDELLSLQQEEIMLVQGMSQETVEKWIKVNKNIYEILEETEDADSYSGAVKENAKDLLKDLTEEEMTMLDVSVDNLSNKVALFGLPWFRYFLNYQPSDFLEKVSCPVLAVNGDKDLQVISKNNLEGIETALKAGGNKDYTIKEFPNLNHLFQKTETGNPTEYAQLEETFSEEVMEYVHKWIMERVEK
ncbi:MAG: alpha/beta fold hydrolase [Bacteroidota bacterium]